MMHLTVTTFRPLVSNMSFSRCISSKTRNSLLRSNENVQKIFCRRKVTTKEEFMKMRKMQMPGNLHANSLSEIPASGYALLTIPIVTFCLGTWQVRRLQWKNNLVKTLNEQTTLPPVPLPGNLEELENMEYQPVKVKGRFIHEKEFTVGPRSLIMKGKISEETGGLISSSSGASKGYLIITPFKLEDRDETILVNRGWVPAQMKNPSTRKSAQVEGTVELTGIVRLNEDRPQFIMHNSPEKGVWMYRDVNTMAAMTGASPVYIDATYENSIPGGPIGGQTKVVLRNEHLSYIFTWYSLSALTAWLWVRQFMQKLPLL